MSDTDPPVGRPPKKPRPPKPARRPVAKKPAKPPDTDPIEPKPPTPPTTPPKKPTKPPKKPTKPPKTKPIDPTLPGGVFRPGEVIAISRDDLLTQAKLDELLDPKTLKAVLSRLTPLIDTKPVDAGAVVSPRLVDTGALTAISRSAAAAAAGIGSDRSNDAVASVVWADGDDELIVHVGEIETETGDGFVDVTIPVECDQTGRVEVVVTLVTAHPDRPFGSVFATTERPSGPRAVVDRWAENLVAHAWEVVAGAAGLIAASSGRDRDNRQLGASSIIASAKGLTVVPMGEHRFDGPTIAVPSASSPKAPRQ